MYGVINKSLEAFARATVGDDGWDRVSTAAENPHEAFVSLDEYPDTLTGALIGKLAIEMGVSPAEVMERFGHYWCTVAAPSDYGPLFRSAGRSVYEAIAALDGLHVRSMHAFPHLQAPKFHVERAADGRLRVEYRSHRTGLAPLVIGMLRGLGEVYGTPVEVTHARVRGPDFDHDEFEVEVHT